MNDIPNKKRILFGLHPDVGAESRFPNEVSILQDDLIYIVVIVEEMDWRVLLAPIRMLLDLHPPIVNAFNNVDSHVP